MKRLAVLLLGALGMVSVHAKPLKIYILAGQSNMQGQAQLFTVPRMALSPESKPLHDKILDKAGKPISHTNVSIVYFTGGDEKKGVKRELQIKKGLLAAGATGSIGPELGFGVTMDEAVDEPILIIKTAWGGKSLNYNFRPPSAGIRPFVPKKSRKKQPVSEEELKKQREEFENGQGAYYRLMMSLIKTVLADPSKYSDAYDSKDGYEIVGFGWFQGYNDQFYYPGSYDHYTKNMAHFIRDVRKELNAPNMPFVIGVMGINGNKVSDKGKELRKCQAATADLPEFKGNVVAVETAGFWDHEMLAAAEKVSKANGLWNDSKHWTVVGTPAPKDRTWNYTSFNLDEEKQYRDLKKGEKGDIKTLTGETPAGMEGWLKPDFDTSKWQKGPACIGKGVWGAAKREKDKKRQELEKSLIRSPWGDGNMLLAKTRFELKRADISHFRLCIRSTSSFHVYLNGKRVKDYPWWKGYDVRKFDIDANDVKQGKNEIAFYGNVREHKGKLLNIVDVYLEGLPKAAAAEIKKQQAATATPRERALARGRSNQAYHYMGSAYTYTLIGQAMAKALLGLKAGK